MAEAHEASNSLTETFANENTTIRIEGSPSERASLFLKLAGVNRAVVKLKQTGKFSAGNTNYKYATEADVIEPIAKALGELGLATIPSVVGQHWHDLPGRYNNNRVCTVHAELMIGDADTGAYVVASTYSTAANSDKASNAAFTTAIKYLLAKLALVAFGDDADDYTLDGQVAAADMKKTAKPTAKATTKKPAAPAISRDKLEDLQQRVKDAGQGEDVKGWLKTNKISFFKMTQEQFDEVEKMIK